MNACHHYLRYSSRRAAFQISIFEKYSRGAREQNLILMRSRVTRSKFNSGLYRNFDLIINRYRGIIGIDFELDYDIFYFQLTKPYLVSKISKDFTAWSGRCNRLVKIEMQIPIPD